MTTKRIPVGTKVKFTGKWKEVDCEEGDDRKYAGIFGVGELVLDDGGVIPYKVEFENGSHAWYYPQEIEPAEKVTEETTMEKEFKVGDYVFVLGKILDKDNSDMPYDVRTFGGGDSAWCSAKAVYPVTTEVQEMLDASEREEALKKLTEREKKLLGLVLWRAKNNWSGGRISYVAMVTR